MHRPNNFTIKYNHELARGLILAALGNAPQSNYYTDSSYYNRYAALTNMDFSTDWSWSNYLNRWSVDFEPTNDYIRYSGTPIPTTGSTFPWTVSFWIYQRTWPTHDSGVDGKYMYFMYHSDGYTYLTNIWTSHTLVDDTTHTYSLNFNSGGRYPFADSDDTRTLNRWVHVAWTYDGSTHYTGLNVYKNGVGLVLTSPTITDPMATNNTGYLVIGGRTELFAADPLTRMLDGKIADILIYNRVLSLGEIRKLGDPANTMLSGMIVPPKRKLWYVRSVPALTAKRFYAIRGVLMSGRP